MNIRQIKKVLRQNGWRYTTPASDKPEEVFVRKMLPGGVLIEGFAAAANDYPAIRPGITYLILCHDWDRRANATWRQEFAPTPHGLQAALNAAERHLAQGYDAPRIQDAF